MLINLSCIYVTICPMDIMWKKTANKEYNYLISIKHSYRKYWCRKDESPLNECPRVHNLYVLRAVLKNTPSETYFRLTWCAVLGQNVPLWSMHYYVSPFHCANVVLSSADYNMSFYLISFEVAYIYNWKKQTNKQTNKQTKPMQRVLTFGHFAQVFMLQNLAFSMQLRCDEVCTMPIWSMFQKPHFFRTVHRANLKHVSE